MYFNKDFTILLFVTRSTVPTSGAVTGNNEAKTRSQDNIAERLSAINKRLLDLIKLVDLYCVYSCIV